MKVVATHQSEYADQICKYFTREFPANVNPTKSELIDILTDILVGDKNLRYGSIPSPEILVNVRNVIRDAVDKSLPIPVLVPWGGRKTDPNSDIDIAEISGIKQINLVDEKVRKFYAPGLQVSMRIEDINAMWLYRKDEGLIPAVKKYSNSMRQLNQMLPDRQLIFSAVESDMMDTQEYFSLCERYSNLLTPAIWQLELGKEADEIEEMKRLWDMGWKGSIPEEQRMYYLGRYKALYNVNDATAVSLLADYFAGSKARYDLGAKGNPKTEVNGFIQVNFAHAVPNAPAGLFSTTLYWRTIPANEGRTHIAPWRAKGYLKINGNNVTPKVVSWSDPVVKELNKESVDLYNGPFIIEVQTDYLVEA